jgi:NADPH:quinone reductase-like Zn-dependent oxidoreductase
VQAISITTHGGPDVLELRAVPDPVPGPGEVLVELRAAAVNRRDVLVRGGIGPAYRFPMPLVLGSDGAGIRRDTGEEIVILPSLDWGGSELRAGPDFRILGGPDDGTYAELVVVPEANAFPKPAGLTWTEAAALPLAALTAYRALFTMARLQPGETVLILGVGSGVSLAAIQLAVHAGARVIVTSSSDDKLRRAAELGSAAGFDYTEADWVGGVIDRTGGVDVVLDSVGSTWPDSLAALAPGGRLVACGATGGGTATLSVRGLYLQQKQILGTKMGSPKDFAELLDLTRRGAVRPIVDSTRPLGDAAAAHRRLESGRHFGKLVLTTA